LDKSGILIPRKRFVLVSKFSYKIEKTFGLTEENIGIRMAEIMKKLGATEIVEEVKNALQ